MNNILLQQIEKLIEKFPENPVSAIESRMKGVFKCVETKEENNKLLLVLKNTKTKEIFNLEIEKN